MPLAQRGAVQTDQQIGQRHTQAEARAFEHRLGAFFRAVQPGGGRDAHLISALARAQVGDTELTLRARKLDSHVELRISSAAGLVGAEEGADPMLERSGVGLGVALADLLIRLHGATLRERHHGSTWTGYVIRF